MSQTRGERWARMWIKNTNNALPIIFAVIGIAHAIIFALNRATIAAVVATGFLLFAFVWFERIQFARIIQRQDAEIERLRGAADSSDLAGR